MIISEKFKYVDVSIFVCVCVCVCVCVWHLLFYLTVTQVIFSVKLADLHLGDICLEFVQESNLIFKRV